MQRIDPIPSESDGPNRPQLVSAIAGNQAGWLPDQGSNLKTCGLIWLPLSRGHENFCLASIMRTNKPDRRGDGLICDDGRAN